MSVLSSPSGSPSKEPLLHAGLLPHGQISMVAEQNGSSKPAATADATPTTSTADAMPTAAAPPLGNLLDDPTTGVGMMAMTMTLNDEHNSLNTKMKGLELVSSQISADSPLPEDFIAPRRQAGCCKD